MVISTTPDSRVIKDLTSLIHRPATAGPAAAQATELAPPRSMRSAERQMVNQLMERFAEGKVSDNDMRDFVIRLSEVHVNDPVEFQGFLKTARVSHHEREAFAAGIRSGIGFGTISYTGAYFAQKFIDLMKSHPEWPQETRERFANAFAYLGPALGFGITGNLAFMIVSNWINHHQLGSFTHNSQLAHLGIEGRHLEVQIKETQWRFFSLVHTAGGFFRHRYPNTPYQYATQRGWIQSPLAGIGASLWKSSQGFRNDDTTRLPKMSEPQLRHVAEQNRLYHSSSRVLGVSTGPALAFAKELTVWGADVGKSILETIHPAHWPAWRAAVSKNGAVGMLTFAAGLSVAMAFYGRSTQLTNRALLEHARGQDSSKTKHAAYVWHQVANAFTLAEVFVYRGWVQNWLNRAFKVPGAGPMRAPGLTANQAAEGLRSPHADAAGRALQAPEDPEAGTPSPAGATIAAARELVAQAQAAKASGAAVEQLPTDGEKQKLERSMTRVTNHHDALRTGLEKAAAHQGDPADAQAQDELYASMASLIADAREIAAMSEQWTGVAETRGRLTTAIDHLEQAFGHLTETQAKQMTRADLVSIAEALCTPETRTKNVFAGLLAASFSIAPGDRRYLNRQDVRAIMTPILAADPASFGRAAAGVRRIQHDTLNAEQLRRLSEDIARSAGDHTVKQRLLQLVSDRISPTRPANHPDLRRSFGPTEWFWAVRPWVEHMAQLDDGTQKILVDLVNALRDDRAFDGREKEDLNGYVQDLPEHLLAKFDADDGARSMPQAAVISIEG